MSAVLPGKVFLTGAGPGSAGLLTLRALEVLQRADLVLHDDLVCNEVLALIPPHIAVHNVGKRCGLKKTTQEEIHSRMIAAARSGQNVVRLKGGDPLIFGRTQEEIRALRQAKIDFEIVPGITAASAAAAAAEIPLTDRDHGSHLVISSNHACAANGSPLWHKSVSRGATLVFYMPGGGFAPLSEELALSGLSEDTPCLLVSQAARPGQQLLRTSLRSLAALPALPAPSVLIVGQVAAEARNSIWTLPQDAASTTNSPGIEEFSLSLEESRNLSAQ